MVGPAFAPQTRSVTRFAGGGRCFEVGVVWTKLFVGCDGVGEVEVLSGRRHDARDVGSPAALDTACRCHRCFAGIGNTRSWGGTQVGRPVARQTVGVGRSLAAGAGGVARSAGRSGSIVVLVGGTKRLTSGATEVAGGGIAAGTERIRGVVGQTVCGGGPFAMASCGIEVETRGA